jgi:capsular exopolysaccharide synthesis family protein
LIDSDLRKPAFKAGGERIGLSKLLTSDDRLDDHIIETQHQMLWLLPSGPVPPNPADLLSTGRIRKIIAEAGDRFDLVVIDGPPTLGLADAPMLGATAEAVLFVIESAKTRTRSAIEALNRLEATGTRLLGAILTKANEAGGAYGYGQYGYGYRYGKGKLKGTEILMIARGEEESADALEPEESDA